MKLFTLVLFYLLLTKSIYAYELYDNMIQEKVWKRGETLLAFMEENDLPLSLYYNLDDDEEKLSSDIRGNTLYQMLYDEKGAVKQVLIPLNEELQIHIYREYDGKYTLEIEPVRYQIKDVVLDIGIESVFSKDIVKKSGNFPLAVTLEQIFKKEVKFERLKKGDRVIAFYTQKVRLGKFYGTQKVDCALIKTKKKSYYRFLAQDGNYYDQDGKTTNRSSFMVPCKYRRISSGFTLKRWHPILRKFRAHHGIDYAGAVGTPVYAAYDGRVIFMGRKGGYGNTIIIKHPGGYKTLYAHLSRFNDSVRMKKVKKGKLIGYLGNSGMSTGPHLHFGLSLNNRWINPAKKIVFTQKLSGKRRKTFLKHVKLCKTKIDKLLLTEEKDGKDRNDG